MKTIFLFLISGCLLANSYAQQFVSRWQKVYGGRGRDVLSSARLTSDGGFILSGYSNSDIFGTKKQKANNGSNDYWIVKTDAGGNVQWSKTIGGDGDDISTCVLPTKDGGYLLGGISVSNISVNKTDDSRDSSYDYWVVKLDASGNILWDNTFGGTAAETLQTLGEGSNYYIAAGSSYSDKRYEKTDDNIGNEAWSDYWLVKMTTSGTLIWSQSYAGGNQDVLTGFQVCSDGGLYLGGYSYSPQGGQKSTASLGNCDYYVNKTDPTGKAIWDHSYGNTLSDYMTDLKQTKDSGFILGGYSNSPAGKTKTAPFLGGTDFWIAKTNKDGAPVWDKTFGNTGSDFLLSVQITSDKGFLLGGYSNSNKGNSKSENSKGGYDYWVVKTDSLGNKQWDRTIGGSGDDTLVSAIEVSPGEYLMAGTSASPKSGNKTLATIGNSGKSDYWLVRFGVVNRPGKTSTEETSSKTAIAVAANNTTYNKLAVTLSPNPASDELTATYSNANSDNTVTLLSAGGVVLEHYSVKNSSGVFHMNVSKYPAGIYYLSFSAGTKTVVRKFVKN